MTLSSSKSKWQAGLLRGAALCALAVLAGCTAWPSSSDNPIVRKFSWFSYMEGGDLKNTCAPGAPSRYRLIYNGIYTEQVRVYNLDLEAGRLEARLIEPMDLRNFEVEGVSDLLNPWRGKTAERAMGTVQMNSVLAALEDDGAFGPPAVGVELPSMGFFWTIAACHQGAYHFTGLAWPSEAWDQAHFDDVLFALDPITAPVNPPRETRLRRDPHAGMRYDTQNEFIVKVGEDGLAGFEPLL